MDEKLRILLCEDDENLGMLLREYLQAKGYSAELCRMVRLATRLSLRTNTTYVYWM